jgi:hypothetical protein
MIKAAAEDKQVPNRNEQTKTAILGLEEWIRRNRGALNSTDGQAARYMLAVILEEQAQSGITRDQQGVPSRVTTPSRQTLTRVEKLLKDIADEMQKRGPRARVVEFAGVGHAPMLLAEDQIKVVKDFLLAPE